MSKPPLIGRSLVRDLVPFGGRRAAKLVPRARGSGPMPWVIAIMIALTVMAAAAGDGRQPEGIFVRAQANRPLLRVPGIEEPGHALERDGGDGRDTCRKAGPQKRSSFHYVLLVNEHDSPARSAATARSPDLGYPTAPLSGRQRVQCRWIGPLPNTSVPKS